MTSLLAVSAMAGVTGVGSALVPVINAEAYAGVTATRSSELTLVAVVVALAAGQTVGKLVLFESARRGAGRWSAWVSRRHKPATAPRETRLTRMTERMCALLGSDRTGPPVVLAAAALGLPPLAAVSLAAGACGQRRWLFGVLCLVGRTARFGTLAVGLVWLSL